MANSTEFITYNIQVNTETGQVNIDGITKGFEDAEKSFRKLEKSVKGGLGGVNKQLDGSSKAAGAATSATLEFGRVLSDMPYGIRGVANNLQQLGSNLFFMSKQVDSTTGKAVGFGGALKSLGSSLLGPAGILIAFQGLIALFDYLSQQTKETTEDQKKLNDEFERTQKILSQLNAVQEVIAVSGDAIDLSSDWIQSFVSGTNELDEKGLLRVLERDIKGITDAFNKLSEDEQNLEGIKNLINQRRTLVEAELDEKKIKEELIQLEKTYSSFRTKTVIDDNAVKKAKEELIAKQKELLATQKQIIDLEKIFEKPKKETKDKITPLKDPETFQKEAEDYLRQIRAVQKKIAMLGEKDAASKLIMQRYFHLEELKQKHKQNLEKFEQETKAARASLKIELDKQLAVGNITKSQHKTALDDFDKNASQERQKTEIGYKLLLGYHKNYYEKAIQIQTDAAIQSAEIDERSPIGMGGATPEEVAEKQREIFAIKLELYMQFQQGVTDFMNGEFDRQITIEQNKTNAINNELRERLNNENLSQEERKRIQLQIAKNDEALRKKQEKIERKRFNFQKAANISQALISTYLAAAQVQANPALVDPLSKKLAMIFTITTGLLNVAKIARQKFQSSAGATSTAGSLGGGGGEQASRSFNFNLAGSTGENQLAQTLQGRFDQPLQAYVVSRDITNAQQLQEDIQNNASFG